MEYKTIIKGNAPSKANCYKIVSINGHGCLAKTSALKKYEESFIWQAGKLRDLNINEPFEFYIDVYYPSRRSDLDNVLKLQLDVLQRIKCIKNDNNCCLIHARKFVDKENPRVEIMIKNFGLKNKIFIWYFEIWVYLCNVHAKNKTYERD